MKKETLKIDHLLGFACPAKKKSNEGGLAGLQCPEAQDQAKWPNDKGSSSSSGRRQARSQVQGGDTVKRNKQCVSGKASEHWNQSIQISRDQESPLGKWTQRSGNQKQRAFWAACSRMPSNPGHSAGLERGASHKPTMEAMTA